MTRAEYREAQRTLRKNIRHILRMIDDRGVGRHATIFVQIITWRSTTYINTVEIAKNNVIGISVNNEFRIAS